MKPRRWIAPSLLLGVVAASGVALAAWKDASLAEAEATAASQPEPTETVAAALAQPREHVRTTTSIGTVLALRSVTLRNELAGTVRQVLLVPGEVVEEGALLVALDVEVEEAELQAQEAQAALAETVLARLERASEGRGVSAVDVDRARAERDIALANVARTKAVIARKTIRAPFRARVGLSDVHPGQFLAEGTALTTLQGVDDAVHVDFTVAQEVGALLREGDRVDVLTVEGDAPVPAVLVALDARVDPATRNALVRARIDGAGAPAPGSSVRVQVPVGERRTSVAVPVSALRRGPAGDHVYVLEPDDGGRLRAHLRQVEAGTVLGDEVVVDAGLQAGERVAAAGSFKLHDQVLVAVAGAPAEGGSP